MSLFFQPEFAEKGRGSPNLDWLRGVSGRINIISLSFFLEVLAEKTDSRFSKFFGGDIFSILLNIFATAAPKRKQKFHKFDIFDFNYCKLPELAGCSTPFKPGL